MTRIRIFFFSIPLILLAACGSSGSGDTPTAGNPQPVAKTVAGKITGFGSIYVNGVEFDTDSAEYDIDDAPGMSDSDLSVGMVVKVRGTLNADGSTGTADLVYYDDDLEGPVANLMADPDNAEQVLFTIFDTLVVAGPGTIFESEDGSVFDITTIADGDNVEVSGDWLGDRIFASYIEKQDADDDEYEVKGTIVEYGGADTFVLRLENGTEFLVTLAAGAEIPSSGLMVEQYVEVEGSIPDPVNAPYDLLATEVEVEDRDYFDEEDDEVEIKGPLSLNAADGSWSINGTAIAFGTGTEYDPQSLADAIADGSADGLVVKVEGRYVEGVLVADEVEDEADDLEFAAVVDGVDPVDAKNGTITVAFGAATGGSDGNGRLDVIVNNATLYGDDDAMSHFDLRTLSAGTWVEVHARLNEAGDIVAGALEIEDGPGVEIEGPVDAIDETSISVFTVIFARDATTAFEGGIPEVGDYVELEDENADGTADSVEIED